MNYLVMQPENGLEEAQRIMKMNTATIADVEKVLEAFKLAASKDTSLEGLSGKKLAAAVKALTPKDDVSKLLNQAYTYGENWWAKNVLNDEAEGCTKDNKDDKIKKFVLNTDAYRRLDGDPSTKSKVESWLLEKFSSEAGPES